MSKPSPIAACTRRGLLGSAAAALAGAALPAEAGERDLQAWDKIPADKYLWGWIRWVMNAQLDPEAEMTVGIVQIEAHQANTPHLHPNCTEILHVIAGSCEHRVGDQWFKLAAGDTLRIPRNTPHGARTGAEACRCMVLYNTGERQMVRVD